MNQEYKFCPKCGAKLNKEAKFCNKCGHAFSEVQNMPMYNTINNSSTKKSYEEIINRNQNYYLKQFASIDNGSKGKINWASFFLGLIHAGYRNMWKEWLRVLRVPLVILGIALLISLLGMFSSGGTMVLISGALLGIAGFASGIMQIVFAVRFNKLYKKHVEQKIENNQMTPDPKIGRAVLSGIVYSIVISLSIVAYLVGVLGSLSNSMDLSADDIEYEDSYPETLPEQTIMESQQDMTSLPATEAQQSTSASNAVSMQQLTEADIFPSDSSQLFSWSSDNGYYLIPYQDEYEKTIYFCTGNSLMTADQAYYMDIKAINKTENGGLSIIGEVMQSAKTAVVSNGVFEILWNSAEELDYPTVSTVTETADTDLSIIGQYSYYGYVDDGTASMQGDPGDTDETFSYTENIQNQVLTAMYDPDGFIIPDVDTTYIKASDYSWMDKSQLRLAINEVYARHGRSFQTEDLNNYFSSKNWYTPLYSAEEFDDSVLNQYEKKNIEILAALRDKD